MFSLPVCVRLFSTTTSMMTRTIPLRSYMNSQKFKKVDKTKVDKYLKHKTEIDETDAIISEIVGHTQAYKEYESEINKASDTIRRKYASLIRDSKGVTLLDMQMELKKERQRIEDFYRPLIYKESHALKELYDKGKISVDPQSFDSEFMDLVIETTQGEEETESTKQIESSKRQKR